ncbi:MAG: S8/S53 family peptidase [Ginsengibacter sp.]
MTTFKVNVNKLNLRSSPVNDFEDKSNVVGVLHQDTTFESAGEITNELGTWHSDRDGHWASENWLKNTSDISLPLALIQAPAIIEFDEDKMSWAFSPGDGMDILSLWNNENLLGQNVKIAVLDSGINTGIADIMLAVEDKDHDLKSFIKDESVEDDFGHGTSCASIICSQGTGLYGVSPKSKLIIGKIYSNAAGQTPEILLEALQWACEERAADIISMSFSFPYLKTEANDIPIAYKEVADYIQRMAMLQNKLFLASIGNLGENAKEFNMFPANCPGCLSIGAFGHDRLTWSGSGWNTNISFIAPGVDLKGYNLQSKKIVLQAATSFSCPFAAGTLANLLSYFKSKNISYSLSEFISKLIFDPPPMDNSLQSGKGILNPIKTLKNLQL